MENNYLSLSEIKQLKSDLLMPKKSKKSNKSFTSSVSGEFYKMRNKEIGEELEDNIRNVLEIYYSLMRTPKEQSTHLTILYHLFQKSRPMI